MLHALLLDTSAWLCFILCTYVYDVFLCGILQYWVLLLSGLRLRYACWFMLKPTHDPYFVNPNLLFSDYEYQQCYDHCVESCRIMSRIRIFLNLHLVNMRCMHYLPYAVFAISPTPTYLFLQTCVSVYDELACLVSYFILWMNALHIWMLLGRSSDLLVCNYRHFSLIEVLINYLKMFSKNLTPSVVPNVMHCYFYDEFYDFSCAMNIMYFADIIYVYDNFAH